VHFPFIIGDWIIVALAFMGGFLGEVFSLIELGNLPKKNRPETFGDPLFRLKFFVVPIAGAFLGFVYQLSNFNLAPFVAVNIGASAPLIFKTIMNAAPPKTSKKEVD
jgi:hypothetical protein